MSESQENTPEQLSAFVQTEGRTFTRHECQRLVSETLMNIATEKQRKIVSIMTRRGLIPLRTGQRQVQGLSEKQQTILKDPIGLFLQCLRIAHSARITGELAGLTQKGTHDVTIAGALINTGKAKQIAGLESDRKRLKNADLDDQAKAMLKGYIEREIWDYYDLEADGIESDVINMLRENVRHDPGELRSQGAKLVYYLLHCQAPSTGELVPVEERINASIHKDPIYGQIYRGYTLQNAGENLIDVHHKTVAGIERKLADTLRRQGHQFDNLKTYLNSKFGFIPPEPPESA